jgi:hypothetical protein
MAWVFGGKKFGQYTYEHWFDHEYEEAESQDESAVPVNTEQLPAQKEESDN